MFAETETWRAVYEQLLAGGSVREYRSVAWVRSPNWQDAPACQSMRANFEAVHRRVLIERIAILPDADWPTDAELPAEPIRSWQQEQHNHCLHFVLVRESALRGEPDLKAKLVARSNESKLRVLPNFPNCPCLGLNTQ